MGLLGSRVDNFLEGGAQSDILKGGHNSGQGALYNALQGGASSGKGIITVGGPSDILIGGASTQGGEILNVLYGDLFTAGSIAGDGDFLFSVENTTDHMWGDFRQRIFSTAPGGDDTFVLSGEFGQDFIYDFGQGNGLEGRDTIVFLVPGVTSFADLNIGYENGDTIITTSVLDPDMHRLTLDGIYNIFSDADFAFTDEGLPEIALKELPFHSTIEYTAHPDYSIVGGQVLAAPQSIYEQPAPITDNPVAQDDYFLTDKGTAVSGNFSGRQRQRGDSDSDGGQLMLQLDHLSRRTAELWKSQRMVPSPTRR